MSSNISLGFKESLVVVSIFLANRLSLLMVGSVSNFFFKIVSFFGRGTMVFSFDFIS